MALGKNNNASNALALRLKWGAGPVSGSPEIAEFIQAMKEAGLEPDHACALGYVLRADIDVGLDGGTAWEFDDSGTLASRCGTMEPTSLPPLPELLASLKAFAPGLGELVAQKISARQKPSVPAEGIPAATPGTQPSAGSPGVAVGTPPAAAAKDSTCVAAADGWSVWQWVAVAGVLSAAVGAGYLLARAR